MARIEPSAPIPRPGTAPEPESLTEIEGRILEFMVQYLRANTYQPSIREIGRRFGIKSTKTVSEHLQALARKGFLERDSSRSRAVRILGVDLSTDTVAVPCFDEVPENPSVADRGDVPLISIDRKLGGGPGSFFLRARPGDLAEFGVEEGDFVLIAPVTPRDTRDGSIVLARLGTAACFHRIHLNGRGAELQALTPGGERVLVEDRDDLTLVGRLAGFYRKVGDAAAPTLTRH